jgi:hypothetical protein
VDKASGLLVSATCVDFATAPSWAAPADLAGRLVLPIVAEYVAAALSQEFWRARQTWREDCSMTQRSTSADFVTAFATGWPEQQPDLMIISLTTKKGVQDFAVNKEQALLIAKTIKRTAAQLSEPGPKS